ncbi:3-oxo-5-alpha-steroid 4-dehydrogenase 2a [Anguilla rostrata]|uniref:3-oxo-5-alpha-steroid 4-dehydrogenase 2a n=1 Tax=Anguilla rostrata TaxID=7938 RepID=UPI0030CA850D
MVIGSDGDGDGGITSTPTEASAQSSGPMACSEAAVQALSGGFVLAGVAYLLAQTRRSSPYGRYVDPPERVRTVPARAAWFLQELPSFLVPVGLMWSSRGPPSGLGPRLLAGTFCLHYFQRTFIYSLLTKGRPYPLRIVLYAAIFCSMNGFFQGYYMLHCARYDEAWASDIRLVIGLILFFLGMAINVHSDYVLRSLREPGEVTYKIPKGGLFEYVSGANFFGEIVEWSGYAIATWSLPGLSFALFTVCSIGPRAYHHHRFYLEKFEDYPRSRKALVPFIF